MSRGNDAIPSWSGFNYQGKMMLLCTIEKINTLISCGEDLNNYEVELENKEDYSFVKEGSYTAFYQVKASISKYKWLQYEEALKKLLDHRSVSGNPSAKCFFVVAREFTDWLDPSNQYKSLIELYKYNMKIVDIIDVKENVINEIGKLLSFKGKSAINIEAVYGALCIFLDDKIANMHKQQYKKRQYTIFFSEILDLIICAANKQNTDAEYVFKEKVYEHMYQNVNSAMSDICMLKCGTTLGQCTNQCAARCAAEQIMQLSNIRDYCRMINPAEQGIWDNDLQYTDHFTKDSVKKYILTCFAKSENHSLIKSKGNTVGMISAHNPIGKGLVIPTLLKFEEQFKNIEDSMQCKLQRIKDNGDNTHDLYGNSIIVDSSDELSQRTLSQAQITAAWDKVNEKSIKAMEDDIGFLSYGEIIKKFEEEGGNHE